MPCDGTDCYEQVHWVQDYLSASYTKKLLGVDVGRSYNVIDMELNQHFDGNWPAAFRLGSVDRGAPQPGRHSLNS